VTASPWHVAGATALLVLGALWCLTGTFAFAQPELFYSLVPGLASMGAYNMHFVRDVGLAFFASGAALLWGTWHREKAMALAGASWPFLHALFHLQVWAHRGFPLDLVFAFDLLAVMAPAVLAVVWLLTKSKAAAH
jgi:hypothetical protein